MDDNIVSVLLVEDNQDDAYLIGKALAETREPTFHLEHVSRLSEGIKRISQGGIDAVLLDLSLPDSHRFNTFSSLQSQAPHVPVVLLTGLEDEKLAVQAARQGAQDYLVKSHVDGRLLARSLRYALERHRLLMESERQAQENARLYQDLESSREEMAVVDSVARILTSTLNIDQVYEQFALEVKKLVDFDRIHVTVEDQANGAYTSRYLFSPTQPECFTNQCDGYQTCPEHNFAGSAQTLTSIKQIEPTGAGLQGEPGQLEEKSSLDLTLISNGRIIGSMGVRSCRADAYGPREQTILDRLASQIAPALENSELYKQLQATMEEMAVVHEVARIMTSTLEIDQVYEMFAQEVKKLANFDRIAISTANLAAGTYTATYQYGLPVVERSKGATRKLSGTDLQRAILGQQTVFRVYSRDSEDKGDIDLLNAGLRSGITTPLVTHGKVIGTLTLHSCQVNAYGERERIVLERLANQIAPAVENAQLYQETLRAQEALRESEIRFRQLYDEAPVGYQEVDARGLITRVNRTELEMLGYAAEEMLGQPARKFIVAANLSDAAPNTDPRALCQPGQNSERTFRRRDGSTIPTLMESRALLDEEGKLTGLRCTIQDITERKHTEEHLQEANRLASIGELAAGVAHEINNPLTSILGFSQILMSEDLPPPVKEDLQKIYFGAQRASRIVQSLLSFARKRQPEKRLVELPRVLERALDLKSFDFKTGNIEVVCQLDESLPHALADEFQLIQVILNILNNAQQATQESDAPGQLVIRTSHTNDRIRISISDNGPGIPPEYLGKIFQPFFTTKSVGAGTGLGLSICYGIIHQHQGELWAESSPGRGTTFHIELPIATSHAESAEPPAEPDGPPSHTKHLLVVDDEPHIRDLLARSLEQQRYTVDLAEDGQEAWRKLQSRSYDCIIMDLKMPNMSGEQLYGLIEASHPRLVRKLIFMTGDMVTPETRAFVSRVSSPTLSKPFQLEDLHGYIRALLE